MEVKQAKKIVAIMATAYPNYQPPNLDMAAEVWADMTKDYTYDEVASALKAYIATDKSGFAPSIGQVIDKIHTIRSPDVLSDAEAWSLVWDAIQNAGYDSVEEFAKLPETVKRAVGSADILKSWAIDEYFSYEKTRTNFLFSYNREVKRDAEMKKLPSDVKKLMESTDIGIEEK